MDKQGNPSLAERLRGKTKEELKVAAEALGVSLKELQELVANASTPATVQAPESPLLAYLRRMSKDQRLAFAAACGTTEIYLYQLAAKKEPNPTLRLAKAIHEESKKLSRHLKAPGLEYDELLIGTPNGK